MMRMMSLRMRMMRWFERVDLEFLSSHNHFERFNYLSKIASLACHRHNGTLGLPDERNTKHGASLCLQRLP
jgi:hypothetical protein